MLTEAFAGIVADVAELTYEFDDDGWYYLVAGSDTEFEDPGAEGTFTLQVTGYSTTIYSLIVPEPAPTLDQLIKSMNL